LPAAPAQRARSPRPFTQTQRLQRPHPASPACVGRVANQARPPLVSQSLKRPAHYWANHSAETSTHACLVKGTAPASARLTKSSLEAARFLACFRHRYGGWCRADPAGPRVWAPLRSSRDQTARVSPTSSNEPADISKSEHHLHAASSPQSRSFQARPRRAASTKARLSPRCASRALLTSRAFSIDRACTLRHRGPIPRSSHASQVAARHVPRSLTSDHGDARPRSTIKRPRERPLHVEPEALRSSRPRRNRER
jgi:hypothetical protein